MTTVPDAAPPGVETPSRRPIRVLVVEDDPGDALLVEEHLADADLDVDLRLAQTLDEAVERLDVDCVLLDLGLPDANGLPALERLLAAGAPAVVVLTGLSSTDLGLAAVAAGAQDYLLKDEVDGPRLARSVRYAVQRRRLEEADRELFRSDVLAQESTRLERALLPRPAVRDAALEIQVGYRAGRAGVLGGDFYDVVERADGTVLALVGDVCGHGPDEAALGATLRTAWRTLVLADVPTGRLFELLERVLLSERARPEVFTTVAMLEVASDRRHADLYLAGHPVPLFVGPPAVLAPTSMRGRALGIPVPGGWQPAALELGPRWRVLMYTDGLLEATVLRGGRLDKAGLRAVVDEESVRPVAAGEGDLVERVVESVRTLHGGDLVDDAALVLVGWGE